MTFAVSGASGQIHYDIQIGSMNGQRLPLCHCRTSIFDNVPVLRLAGNVSFPSKKNSEMHWIPVYCRMLNT